MRVLPETTRAQVQAIEQTVIFEDRSFRIIPSILTITILSSALYWLLVASVPKKSSQRQSEQQYRSLLDVSLKRKRT
jgi:hypothetical protein